jgi:hypothetical protein
MPLQSHAFADRNLPLGLESGFVNIISRVSTDRDHSTYGVVVFALQYGQ